MKPIHCLTLAAVVVTISVRAGAQVAQDNADFSAYSPQPDHAWSTANGGFGFGLWTPISDTSGGGTFMEGVGVNGRQVEGNFSFALFSGSGAFDISRPLTTSLATGTFSIITRFDLAGSGPNLVNIRTGNNTTSFGGGELLSFGINNGSSLSYTDSTGTHAIASGESRGNIWDWTVTFDATAGTYSLSVADIGGGTFTDTVSGTLDASGTTVGSFGVINSSTGNNQNLIFDAPTFDVPEPSTFALWGLCGAIALIVKRRKTA